jgi:hypothetical protein
MVKNVFVRILLEATVPTQKSCVQNRCCVEIEPVLENVVLRQHKLLCNDRFVHTKFVFLQHKISTQVRFQHKSYFEHNSFKSVYDFSTKFSQIFNDES